MLVAGVLLAACSPDELLPYTPPKGAVNKTRLEGNWKVTRLTITDQTAAEKNFPYKTLDATADLGLDKMVLQLAPGSFTVAYNGAVPVFGLASGNWKTDNDEKPGLLTFMGTADTIRTTLGPYTTFQNNRMVLKQAKVLEGKTVTIYEYELQKQ